LTNGILIVKSLYFISQIIICEVIRIPQWTSIDVNSEHCAWQLRFCINLMYCNKLYTFILTSLYDSPLQSGVREWCSWANWSLCLLQPDRTTGNVYCCTACWNNVVSHSCWHIVIKYCS